jgi:hypothetical protein
MAAAAEARPHAMAGPAAGTSGFTINKLGAVVRRLGTARSRLFNPGKYRRGGLGIVAVL